MNRNWIYFLLIFTPTTLSWIGCSSEAETDPTTEMPVEEDLTEDPTADIQP